ncbi:DNA/RNA helicase domain-containing protein [Streptomyces sp. NPDC020875]|uniref:DNA/RNA helicase domain-containing protein n=1 Tax=Streptomyces sp. NPDC020875 TaxID=3154898 RepID=UPI0033CFE432
MHLYEGSVAELAPRVNQPDFIVEAQRRFVAGFGVAPNWEEVRSWRFSWPALMDTLVRAGLGDLHILLEYSLPATGQRIDALLLGEAPDGRLCTVVIELKQWTKAESSLLRRGVLRVGARDVQHPARQVGCYAQYLKDWVAREEIPLLVRGVAVLHDAEAPLIDRLRELAEAGPSRDFPVLGRGDLTATPSAAALAERLGCADLRPASPVRRGELLNAEHRPNPGLLSRMGKAIEGNDALTLIGEQDLARQEVLHAVETARTHGTKSIIVVTGGPGTGKTVIAGRIMGDLCVRPDTNPRLLCPSGTLTHQLKRIVGEVSRGLIATFLDKIPVGVTSGSVVLIDEAHRVRTYPDAPTSRFPFTLGKLIDRASITVLFLDERQIVRPNEGITREELERYAMSTGYDFRHIDLTTQFRCNGSQAYLRWVDQLFQPDGTAAPWEGSDYDLALADDPEQFSRWVETHVSSGPTARITAGFCWHWTRTPTPRLPPEVVLEWEADGRRQTWARPWNSPAEKANPAHPGVPARPFWATDTGGHGQVGCIYTAQGMEYAYNVVIMGDDLIRRDGRWRARPDASHDDVFEEVPPHRYLRYALNIYRVLATRGTLGTRFYSTDPATQAYLESLLPSHQPE